MEDAPIIAGLLEKRAEIETALAELERQIRVQRLEIAQPIPSACSRRLSLWPSVRLLPIKRSVHLL
jgi:hypothetical protein